MNITVGLDLRFERRSPAQNELSDPAVRAELPGMVRVCPLRRGPLSYPWRCLSPAMMRCDAKLCEGDAQATAGCRLSQLHHIDGPTATSLITMPG